MEYELSTEHGTNKNVTISVTATDNVGIEKIILPDDTEVASNKATYEVSQNGNYKFIAVDISGNRKEIIVEVSNIDKENPEIDYELSTTEWTNQNVTITVNASDNDGVKKIILPDNKEVNSNQATYEVSENGEYEFTAVDISGNRKKIVVKVTNIDKESPLVSYKIIEDKEDSVIVEFEMKDSLSGIKSIVNDKGLTALDGNKFELMKNVQYTFTVSDNAGNINTINILQEKEEDKPIITFTVNSINNKSTEITGNGVAGATVKAYVNNKQIGNTATVNSSGKYTITIPAQSSNTKIVVQMSKSGYETEDESIKVNGIVSRYNKSLTKDIYKYDAGKSKHLTYINGKGYSQYLYLNKSEKYAFTPSSWMVAAGLNVSMPTSSNNYTMMIDNPYITMYNQANELLNDMKSSKVSKEYVKKQLQQIEKVKTEEVKVDQSINALSKSAPKKSLTNDIYKYDAGKGKYLTYINGKGYSQYSYLNKSGKYAFTPSSWMVAAGLNVSMPTSSNGYTMKIDNPYITRYNNVIKQIESYI